MDIPKMMEILRIKHGARLDADDSVFLLASLAEEIQTEGRQELATLATNMVDQVSTAIVLAENAAHARGERLLSAGIRMGSEQIQAAGDAAARRVGSEVKELLEQVEAVKHEAVVMVRVSWAAAAVSVLAVVTLISWQVWGPA